MLAQLVLIATVAITPYRADFDAAASAASRMQGRSHQDQVVEAELRDTVDIYAGDHEGYPMINELRCVADSVCMLELDHGNRRNASQFLQARIFGRWPGAIWSRGVSDTVQRILLFLPNKRYDRFQGTIVDHDDRPRE